MDDCTTIEVDGADDIMVNGRYFLSKDYVSWAQDKPVYKHMDLPYYIYWNDDVAVWTIGPRAGLQHNFIYFYKSKLTSSISL